MSGTRIVSFGIKSENRAWEPAVPFVYSDAPKYLEMKLERFNLNQATRQALKRKNSMRVGVIATCSG